MATSAALQPDGKIVVAGYGYAADQSRSEIVVARYRPDGTLDQTFGDAGIVITALSASEPSYVQAQDVAIQPDGRIVTVGMAAIGNRSDVAVARFRSDGSLDPHFGEGGFATLIFSADSFEDAPALSLLPNGKITVLAAFDSTWGLARLRPDGRLDTGFGAGGMVRSDRYGEVSDLLAQADGRLVVVGRSSPGGGHYDVMLVRYRRDGRLDHGFGTGGIVTTDIAESTDGAAAVTLGPNRTLVVAGSTEPIESVPPYADLLVARYHR